MMVTLVVISLYMFDRFLDTSPLVRPADNYFIVSFSCETVSVDTVGTIYFMKEVMEEGG